jgi:hypothetical protein
VIGGAAKQACQIGLLISVAVALFATQVADKAAAASPKRGESGTKSTQVSGVAAVV